MKLRKLIFISGLLLGFVQTIDAQNLLITYPAPQGTELKNDFTVKVRQPGGEWQAIATYPVKVDEVKEARHHVELASMSYFDFNGEVEVSVTAHKEEIETARIRPLSYGITPQVSRNTLTFKLNSPRNLSIEVNGDIFHNLHLFANPIDRNNPLKPGMNPKKLKKNRNLIYFGPGIHQLPGDTYNPQIQISAESETKRSIFREKDKTKRSKKESAQHSKSRNKSFVMTSVSAL